MPVPESPVVDLLAALQRSVDRARADRRAREVRICDVGTCTAPAQPEHSPCCSSTFHGKSLCCEHYCRTHFVEANPCTPAAHEVGGAHRGPNPDCAARRTPHGPHELMSAGGGNKPGARCDGLLDPEEVL